MPTAHSTTLARKLDADFDSKLQAVIDSTLGDLTTTLGGISPLTTSLVDSLQQLMTGGKRMRPRLALWAYLGALPHGYTQLTDAQWNQIALLGASLEFFQAAALLHDDLIDRSDIRRGKPTAHRAFAAMHTAKSRVGSADQFGLGAAILAGDLALIAAQTLISRLPYQPATPDPDANNLGSWNTIHLFHAMATEVTAGQFLDLTAESLAQWGTNHTQDQELAFAVIRSKSARYSCELPLDMGAVLAGASTSTRRKLAAFGKPLGEAFQLRDDLLGVFGDPNITGKPAGDDIKEGKRTVLMSLTAQRATPSQRNRLLEILSSQTVSDDDVAWVKELAVEVHADKDVEQMIIDRHSQAMAALADGTLATGAQERLAQLAQALLIRAT